MGKRQRPPDLRQLPVVSLNTGFHLSRALPHEHACLQGRLENGGSFCTDGAPATAQGAVLKEEAKEGYSGHEGERAEGQPYATQPGFSCFWAPAWSLPLEVLR